MCSAGTRIYVQEGIYDKFMEQFIPAAEGVTQGDGFDGISQQGPVVSEIQMNVSNYQTILKISSRSSQTQRVLEYIESGKASGANVVTGGSRKGDKGYFVKPTIFTDVKPDMKIVREEIFGPVCVVVKFKTEEEVIELANDSTYGLSSQIFSQDISRALRVAHALEAGQALVSEIQLTK
jgi:aldehyde dehydrogenase (NAD+)